ncbi:MULTISPECIES: hypothetical protein [Polyangium]|uniref:Uncharacterized protein n=2 Tax=Polyangium TaxID=55 RepID=A0A4U1JJF4_9BACT|nr:MULTISPECIES: hypothetical protein [Polyangium]MDI1433017.1 hypothetical protein [Polyangium sorediatum]TKD12632.1 hypothetical protein E8A74_02445 [Polyangium fumosum]
MGINVNNVRATPTRVGGFNGSAFVPVINGQHRRFTWGTCRVNLAPAVANGVNCLSPAGAALGDTIFLPYLQDGICSVRLPDAGNATANGVNSFLTADMSGCKVFIDRVTGSNDLIVYHANNVSNSPPGNAGALNPVLQLPACTMTLAQLHATAAGHYPALAAPHTAVPVVATEISKPIYNIGAAAEVQRKTTQGRTNVEFLGGTVVFGVVAGASWEFYYQTWGSTSYTRPRTAPLRLFSGAQHDPMNSHNWKVLGFARFF